MTETTVQSLAEEMGRAFERKKRNDDSEYVSLKDGSPEWMTNVCHEAHKDGSLSAAGFNAMMPDDWRYDFIEDACDALSEAENADEADEHLHEYITYYDHNRWLASRNDRSGYCDEAREELGEAGDMDAQISQGLHYEQREVLGLVRAALEELVDAEDLDDA